MKKTSKENNGPKQDIFDTSDYMVALFILNETTPYHTESHINEVHSRTANIIGALDTYDNYILCHGINAFLESDKLGSLVKFYGNIKSISSPYPLRLGTDTQFNYDAIDVEIGDMAHDFIKTIPIVDKEKKRILKDLADKYSNFCFYGFAIYGLKRRTKSAKINANNLEYRFFLQKLEPAENLAEIIDLKSDVIIQTRALIDSMKAEHNGILRHIKKEICECAGIRGLESAPLLNSALEFAILQSLSDNILDKRSAKLHSLIIGSPAVGKGKLAETVKILNPIWKEAQPTKASMAGLVGATRQGKGKWYSDPGLIPKAHRGVFIIQDFHDVKNKHEIFGIFSKVMEDGEVIDSAAAQITHRALTSIHIDMNKMIEIYLDDSPKISKGRFKELKKIGIPMQILSRFDFIIDIQRDAERQKGISLEMLKTSSSSLSEKSDGFTRQRIQNTAAIITMLRTDYPNIQIPKRSSNYMARKFEERIKQVKELSYLSDFLTRLAKSLEKIAIATCRANARTVVAKTDVDYSLEFLQRKIDFLMRVKPEGSLENTGSLGADGPQEQLRAYFNGRDIILREAADYMNSFRKIPLGDRQVRRYLDDKFDKPRRGQWRIK